MAQPEVGENRPKRGLGGLARQANPAFAGGAVAIPLLALGWALAGNDLATLTYVHVMAGVLWTGIDLFMGMIVGPVLGGLEPDRRAAFFRTFTPKMTFLMPTLAVVTITGGITLAQGLGKFPHADPWLALMTAAIAVPTVLLIAAQFRALTDPKALGALALAALGSGWMLLQSPPEAAMLAETSHWIVAALVVVTLLTYVGFGVLLPGEIRIYRQLVSSDPDIDLISSIGMRNAKLSGINGLLQLAIIYVMVNIRFL